MSNRELDLRLAKLLNYPCCPWKGCDCDAHPESYSGPAFSSALIATLLALARHGYVTTIEVIDIASGDTPGVTVVLREGDGRVTTETGTLDDLSETVARAAVQALEARREREGGWLQEQFEAAEADVRSWPHWMQRAAKFGETASDGD